ncbi:zinc ion binding protein [Galdieria sulphuraria]|uniref:Zinc ion binding protein n=1 Tax=Galdieria sulphuraria TaxID=130081 RepID=M2W2S2_GALSU|nr:zinc ion binding protein [Galdieria sulphuraria]EME29996.1 zinc ion binding protein [Galdieria sulphuraria]|eukprot:XP_005706516.1 zinc ion binding protein [Galdieria sulphuraria]
MVSFCCDQCQEVVKKPKLEKHFFICRTRSVSCVDCGTTFDRASATSHITCITEKEKYEKQQVSKELLQRLEGDSNLYCKTCNISFNSALQGEQHYQSKRHISATKRRLADDNATTGLNSVSGEKESNAIQETFITNYHQGTNGTDKVKALKTDNQRGSDKKQAKSFSQKKVGLKKAIKKLVVSNGIRMSCLLKKLQRQGFSSVDLERRVRRRIEKSRKLFMNGKRVKLKD